MEVVRVSECGKEVSELGGPHAHDAGFIQSRTHQWCNYCRSGKAMFVWHTLCFLVDTCAGAAVFVYGWHISLVPWPFILPAVGYCVLNVACMVAYLACGPVNSALFVLRMGPLQALQQTYYTLATVLLPTSQKPFRRVWPLLLACSVLALTGRTIATIANTDLSDANFKYFDIVRHGLIGGGIAAIRTLDSLTDLQVGALLVDQARESVCTWKGQEASCDRMVAMAVAQMVMALTDFVIGMYLQFNDMKLAAEKSITKTKLAVHLTSLLCEVGMMAIYIISTVYLQSEGQDGSSASGTPQNHGRSTAQAAIFITFSLCLTATVFFANLYGVGRMMVGVARATSKVRTSMAKASKAIISSVQKSHSRMSRANTDTVHPIGTQRSSDSSSTERRESGCIPSSNVDAPDAAANNTQGGHLKWSASTKQSQKQLQELFS